MRRRLVVVLVTLAALGMTVAGLVVTAQLRTFLLDRVDAQLTGVGAGRGSAFGNGGGVTFPPGSGNGSDRDDRARQALRLFLADASPDGKDIVVDARSVHVGKDVALPHLVPSALVAHASTVDAAARPFTVGSTTSSDRYRMVVRQRSDGTLSIVGVSLNDVDDTVSRLILIEVLVGASVLVALAAIGLWAVRLGLRPLERMATAAGDVAEGDGSWRIEPADDHSEVGRLGKALNTMLGRLERSFAAQRQSEERLRRFLSDASHELRTPLTSIRGYAELFRRGAAERPDDLAKVMSRIEAESARMGVLVEDLLVRARLDEQRPLDLTSVDLTTVVADSAADARAAQPEREWALTAPQRVVITGAEPQLRQVMANLLANVRAHTPAGSPCEVDLTAPDTHGVVRLRVSDHGPGVNPELAGRIFERFTTAEAGRTRPSGQEAGGTGLGLSIVAAIVKAHAGTVALTDTPGGGATVTVELPVDGPAEPGATGAAAPGRVLGENRR